LQRLDRPVEKQYRHCLPLLQIDEQLDEVVMGNRRYSARVMKKKAADQKVYDQMKSFYQQINDSSETAIKNDHVIYIDEKNLKSLEELKPFPEKN